MKRIATKVGVSVGGDLEGEATRGFIDAWHRAERGEKFRERHYAFENWRTLWRVLTGKRMEILGHVRRHRPASVRALAKALKRDYSNVHADVRALVDAKLMTATKAGLRADYDVIETKIKL
ncbi:MAG: hypothetical protein FJX46_13090 [Alphaproteobacteria bacterium]|nr:hypothetical protein [Alphaproteobacteria bacterium]